MPIDPVTLQELRDFAGGLVSVGFTGTASGLTVPQHDGVRVALAWLRNDAREFHHGLCVGADQTAAAYAKGLAYECHGWPGRPEGDPARSTKAPVDVLHPLPEGREPELARNHELAGRHVLLAAPRQDRMTLRSGTWATVRYAHRLLRPVLLALPDGRIIRSHPLWNSTMTTVTNIAFAEILWAPPEPS